MVVGRASSERASSPRFLPLTVVILTHGVGYSTNTPTVSRHPDTRSIASPQTPSRLLDWIQSGDLNDATLSPRLTVVTRARQGRPITPQTGGGAEGKITAYAMPPIKSARRPNLEGRGQRDRQGAQGGGIERDSRGGELELSGRWLRARSGPATAQGSAAPPRAA